MKCVEELGSCACQGGCSDEMRGRAGSWDRGRGQRRGVFSFVVLLDSMLDQTRNCTIWNGEYCNMHCSFVCLLSY